MRVCGNAAQQTHMHTYRQTDKQTHNRRHIISVRYTAEAQSEHLFRGCQSNIHTLTTVTMHQSITVVSAGQMQNASQFRIAILA